MNNSFVDLVTFLILKVIQYACLLIAVGVVASGIIEMF